MARRAGILVLFGGGDAGGFRIGPDGIHPIDPYGPATIAALKAVGTLTSPRLFIKNAAARQSVQKTANDIPAPHMGEIVKSIPA